jgi:hypothetical protein
MSNSLGNGLLNKAYWSKKMQEYRKKNLVAMALCDVSEKAGLSSGDTIHRPYSSDVVGQSYTKGTAFTVQDVSATDDTLTVSTARVAPFYIDDVDKIQNSYSAADEFSGKAMDKLNRFVDADVLAEYANATSYIDAGDVGGSAGTSISPDTTNINKIFTAAGRKLNSLNVSAQNRFAVIGPAILEVLQQYTAGKDTQIGDKVMENGYIGSRFGFDLYISNNLTYTGTWTPSDNPSNGETLTIGGVTFTFVSTIGTTAGNVLQTTNTATTIANLVDLINNPTSTTANHVALSSAQKAALEGLVATDGTTYMSLVGPGLGETVGGGTAQGTWSAEIVHLLFGQKGATALVMQKEPSVEIKDVSDKLGKNFAPWMLYGLKTWNNNKDMLVDGRILATSL